jgi:hypothetical protein
MFKEWKLDMIITPAGRYGAVYQTVAKRYENSVVCNLRVFHDAYLQSKTGYVDFHSEQERAKPARVRPKK